MWERFEDGLSRNGTTYNDIKGIAEDNKIENLIRKYGKIEHDLDVAKVITMFKNGGPQGMIFSNLALYLTFLISHSIH